MFAARKNGNTYHVMMRRQAADIINHMLDCWRVFFLVPQTFSVKLKMNLNDTYTCTLQAIVYFYVYLGQIDTLCKHYTHVYCGRFT